ncbi:Asp-tRNA(Asn)/Glu-tRNA(Gln) amidotransferase subunit GatB [Candidatus Micrarchaeota archaeon]|nr:Asp-tRNA(Asn)/Glu-tRNA(Gln) amidotransferase subunit GatB [Candidatus Micrarchaeota archaeon]
MSEMKIGLETHVTLDTETKLFCGCPTAPAEPNAHTCEICLGLPGSKPVTNEKAVKLAVQAATALGMQLNRKSLFARKTYYYPDLSKNYQITQYDSPLAEKGALNVNGKITVTLTRLHLEEDPAQIVYPHGNMANSTYSLLDYNRSGMPLAEIVTDPCLKSPADAKAYLEALFKKLSYLGVIDAQNERVMKTDANLSIPGGERVEIKNITSFVAVEKALQAEFFRQRKAKQSGENVERQTRLYSEETNTTLLMRTKEQEEDYGYIVEPDLPPLYLDEAFLEETLSAMKELPEIATRRLSHFVPAQYAEVLVFQNLAPYFESSKTPDKLFLAKWVCGDLLKCMNYHGIWEPHKALAVQELDALLSAVSSGKITERAAKEYIKEMVTHQKPIQHFLSAQKGGEMDELVAEVLKSNPQAVSEYLAGKEKSLEFLLGEFLKRHRGFQPNEVREKLKATIQNLKK